VTYEHVGNVQFQYGMTTNYNAKLPREILCAV